MSTKRIEHLVQSLTERPHVYEGTDHVGKEPRPYDGREPFHETWMAHEDKPFDVRLALAQAAWRGSIKPRPERWQLIAGDVLPRAIITYPTGVFEWDFKLDTSLLTENPNGDRIAAYWESYLARRGSWSENQNASPAFTKTYEMVWIGCHSTQDYGIAIEGGINGIRAEAERYRTEKPEAKDWYEAVLISLDGACAYIQAHADAYRQEAGCCRDRVQAAEYAAIAENCEYLALGNAPDSFWQACQLFWFLFYLNGHDSPGRIDQYLAPPLLRELARGTLAIGQAQEITDCLYCKMAEQVAYGSTIGGQTPEGADATNQMTWLCLSCIRRLRLLSPRTALRVHKNTPKNLLQEAVASSAEGATFPTFVNDDIVVSSMIRRGVKPADALDYTFCGCGQVIPSGRAYGGYEDAILNMPKALLLTLHRGKDELTGEQTGVDVGAVESFASFSELEEAVLNQLTHMLALVERESRLGKQWAAKYMVDPLRSALVHSCLEKGKDFRRGGADYHEGLLDALGLTTLADSLTAIRNVVYDQGLCTLRELTDACDHDWEGREDLLQACLNAPKFGNDDDAADRMMVKLVHYVTDDLFQRRTFQGGRWGMDIVGWSGAVEFGACTGATPNGRKKGEALADCAGPSQGMDKSGITAVLRSMAKLPAEKVHGPLVLSAKFSPQAVQGENESKLADLIKAYFAMGGMQLQPTVVSGEDLKKAQREPEKWRHLIVRVGGFSARFVDLKPSFQADMIKRTENGRL